MAITATRYITATSVAALNTAIAAEIAASRYPAGPVGIRPISIYPALHEFSMASNTGATALTAMVLCGADSLADLATQVATQIAASNLPIGGLITVPLMDGGYNGLSLTKARYYQLTGH